MERVGVSGNGQTEKRKIGKPAFGLHFSHIALKPFVCNGAGEGNLTLGRKLKMPQPLQIKGFRIWRFYQFVSFQVTSGRFYYYYLLLTFIPVSGPKGSPFCRPRAGALKKSMVSSPSRHSPRFEATVRIGKLRPVFRVNIPKFIGTLR